MSRIKILFCCPGSWTHGLDSPERGEGRWAQNIARCLAEDPRYEVYAASGGGPTWGRGRPANVVLVREQDAHQHAPYDLYFDSAWWDGKSPIAEARVYLSAHWGFEDRLRAPLPANRWLVYPYRQMAETFLSLKAPNASRSLYLPVPLAAALGTPDPNRRRVICTSRNDLTRKGGVDELRAALLRLEPLYPDISSTWMASMFGNTKDRHTDHVLTDDLPWGVPYNEIFTELSETGLNVPIEAPALVPDASVLGIPSLVHEQHAWEPIKTVGKQFGLLSTETNTEEQLVDHIHTLFANPSLYVDYTTALQDVFRDHVESRTRELFAQIVEAVR